MEFAAFPFSARGSNSAMQMRQPPPSRRMFARSTPPEVHPKSFSADNGFDTPKRLNNRAGAEKRPRSPQQQQSLANRRLGE